MVELAHKELTGAIIGAYYEVYNHTSRTYPEFIYENALLNELQARGYETTQQDEYHIFYKERLVGKQRLDLFVVQEIVVELKATEKLVPLHKVQGLSYLKTVGKQVGLLFNFGNGTPEFDRLLYDPAQITIGMSRAPAKESDSSADWLYPELSYAIVGGLFEAHRILGPGFIHRIYANAVFHELRLRNLDVVPAKRMQVTYKDTVVGDIPFAHCIVEGKVMVFPVAIRNVQDIHLENLKDWMRRSEIQVGILANFNAVRLQVVYVRA